MDTHKISISRTSINNISQARRFVLTYYHIKQSNLLSHWMISSFCSTAASYFQSFILSLEDFIKCIHRETRVHVNWLLFSYNMHQCHVRATLGLPRVHKNHSQSPSWIFSSSILEWWQTKSHVKATDPVSLIVFLVYYLSSCTCNRKHSQKKCAVLNEGSKNVF
jgi:hypothetical protein